MKLLAIALFMVIAFAAAPVSAGTYEKDYNCTYTNAGDGPQKDYDFSTRQNVKKGDVKELQTALHEAGYPSGPIDGVYGPITTKAVRAYQEKRNMPGDGKLTAETLRKLRITSWCGYDHRLTRNYN